MDNVSMPLWPASDQRTAFGQLGLGRSRNNLKPVSLQLTDLFLGQQTDMQAQSSAGLLHEVCLRYAGDLGLHAQISYDQALQMLARATMLAMQQPFVWNYIDKPPEGSLYLVYLLPQQSVFPNDGIRYLDNEVRFNLPNANGDLEVCEIKHGFVPEGEQMAYRLRRRYRVPNRGYQQLWLVHYTRGPSVPVPPQLIGAPIRNYPLRPPNEPAMFVLGEKAGQKVPIPGQPPISGHPQMARNPASFAGMPTPGNHAAMVAQQNHQMENIEQRRQMERTASMNAVPPRVEEDDSADEMDAISTRSLALTRYKRNHDFMNEVFVYAAFGEKSRPPIESPYAAFKVSEMEEKIAKLREETAILEEKAASRKELRGRALDSTIAEFGDVSMEIPHVPSTNVIASA